MRADTQLGIRWRIKESMYKWMPQALISIEWKNVRGKLQIPDEARHAAQQQRISFTAHNKVFQRYQCSACQTTITHVRSFLCFISSPWIAWLLVTNIYTYFLRTSRMLHWVMYYGTILKIINQIKKMKNRPTYN